MHLSLVTSFLVILFISGFCEATKKAVVIPSSFWKHQLSNIGRAWPKAKGRCSPSKAWDVNGVDVLKREAELGNVVVLFLVKKSCSFCMWQLEALNNLALYYRQTGLNVSVIVVNYKDRLVPQQARSLFTSIQIYQERKDQSIFKQVGGTYRDILVYDKCGRQQYHFGYPYSWLGHPYVRNAVHNTVHYETMLCGVCPPLLSATTTTSSVSPSTSQPATVNAVLNSQSEAVPPGNEDA